jgi:hypothetical protein
MEVESSGDLHPTHANTRFHLILEHDSVIPVALLYCIDVHFAVVIFAPLKSFFYYGFGQ